MGVAYVRLLGFLSWGVPIIQHGCGEQKVYNGAVVLCCVLRPM